MSEKELSSVDQAELKEKFDALDVPGAMIEFDPDEAEALGITGDEGVDGEEWAEAVLAAQDQE